MCQAYEGERAAIVSSEKHARKAGYEAAQRGEKQESNPHVRAYDMYRHDAWSIGWLSFKDGLELW